VSSRPGLVARAVGALVAAILLAGCQGGLTARQGRPDRGLTFRSPIEPVEQEIASPADIRSVLAARSQPVRGLRARLEILVGEGGRRNPRQRFQALAYVDPPGFMRVRAQQNGASVFDLLVDGGNATAVVVPERVVYRGSVRELERAPQATLGIAPSLLFETLDVEAVLARRLQRETPEMERRPDGIYLWFAGGQARSVDEIVCRTSDLLVERVTRWQGRRKLGEVRFWAYERVGGQAIVPVEFAIENAAGGAVLVRLSDVRLNEPRTPQLASIDVPQGFAEHDFSEPLR